MSTELDTRADAPPGGILLPPGEVPQWVMIARTGRWEGHPHGPELITPHHLAAALDYYRKHHVAHGTDLPVDYHHASVFAAQGRVDRAPAAGWIRSMELRANGTELWGSALWTAEAARDIAAGQFRYLSPVLRFNAPDRVTGEPVPMLVHSVALTNTPFLTELQALNEQSVSDSPELQRAAHPAAAPYEGGATMTILAQMADALDRPREQLRAELGLQSDQDQDVARALVAHVAGSPGLEQRLAQRRQIANALGVAEDCDEATILNTIADLRRERDQREAIALVDRAIEAGRVPPSQRDFFLACAADNLDGTRECINSLSPMLDAARHAHSPAQPRVRELTEGEMRVCRQLGLSTEAFLNPTG